MNKFGGPLYDKAKELIVMILEQRGEGFLDDDGVDIRVCEEVAEEILDTLEENGFLF